MAYDFDFDRLQRGTQSTGPASEATLAEIKILMANSKIFGTKAKELEQQTAKTAKQMGSFLDASSKVEKSFLDLEEQAEKTNRTSGMFSTILRSLRYSGLGTIQSLGDVGDVVARFGDNFGPVGEALFEGLGKLVKMVEQSVQAYRQTNQVGATFGENINEVRMVAGELGVSLENLTDFSIQAARSLALTEGSVTEGLQQLRTTINGPEFVLARQNLQALGFTTKDVLSGLADYMDIQAEIGRSQLIGTRQMTLETGQFLMNIDLLSKATGMQRQQILDQMKADAKDDRFKLLLGGLADGGQEILKLTGVLQNVSPELANNVKDLIANMGIPQNAAQAGLIANSNIRDLLMKLTRGEGSATEVIGEFQRLAAQTGTLSQSQRSYLTFLNQQGQGFYNYNIQLANGSKVFTKFLETQKLQDEQVKKNTEGSLQFDLAMEKLRIRFQALFTPFLNKLDDFMGWISPAIEKLSENLGATITGLAVLTGVLVGTGGLVAAFRGLASLVGKLSGVLKLLPGVGTIGKMGAGIGAGGAGLAKGGAFAGLGIAALGLGVGAGIGLAAAGVYGMAKALGSLAESLDKLQNIDGQTLLTVAQGMRSITKSLGAFGNTFGVGDAIQSGFAKLFGGGPENFAKNINKTLDTLDKDKIDMYATSLKNLSESFASLQTNMTNTTTTASRSTGDKLDELNTTMQAILMELTNNTRYARITSTRDYTEAVG